MTEKVLCPYCGNEMEVVSGYRMGSLAWVACARCTQKGCDALGPRVEGFDTSVDAEAAALASAQARYLPPNRPLTLDEVKALDADEVGDIPCFVEIEPTAYKEDSDDFDPRLRACLVNEHALDRAFYNKCSRIWLRKPTQAEMDAAGWGGGIA